MRTLRLIFRSSSRISDSRLKEEVKQVEEIPDQMAKGSKDVKIMDKKMVKAGGYDTLQFAVRGEHDGKPFISVNDFILTNSATYMMSFTMKDTDYKCFHDFGFTIINVVITH